jgi:hypothetical protein
MRRLIDRIEQLEAELERLECRLARARRRNRHTYGPGRDQRARPQARAGGDERELAAARPQGRPLTRSTNSEQRELAAALDRGLAKIVRKKRRP